MKTRLRLGLLAAVAITAAAFASSALGQNYVVLYKSQAVPADAAQTIAKAGGTLVYSYGQIGVAIASSDSASFRANLLKDNKIENASGTQGFATQLTDSAGSSLDASGPPGGDLPNTPATDSDSLSPLQWDMRQIFTPEAHAITGGSPAVLVGDIDTGIDFTHPDLAPERRHRGQRQLHERRAGPGARGAGRQRSWHAYRGHDRRSFERHRDRRSGAQRKDRGDQGRQFRRASSSRKRSSAPSSGQGRITSTSRTTATSQIRSCSTARTTPCSGRSGRLSSGRFASPSSRASRSWRPRGTRADDLAHPTQDSTSPDNTTPQVRAIHNDCVVIPVEISGVIGVTADGNAHQTPSGYLKSFYSSFGVGSCAGRGARWRFALRTHAPGAERARPFDVAR